MNIGREIGVREHDEVIRRRTVEEPRPARREDRRVREVEVERERREQEKERAR
jgi:hypothetical protein